MIAELARWAGAAVVSLAFLLWLVPIGVPLRVGTIRSSSVGGRP